MIERDSVKAKEAPLLVGVITSRDGLRIATRMKRPPDLFELRLDHFGGSPDHVRNMIPHLPSPVIITARDFREGGAKQLSLQKRRGLLQRFLPQAHFVDIELRLLPALTPLFKAAQQQRIQRILSVHDFRSTPSLRTMLAKACEARSAGAEVFKIVTRVDKASQLTRLVEFMQKRPTGIRVSAMGIGKLGATSRIVLSRLGSAMIYAYLGTTSLEGQPSLSRMRRLLQAKSEQRTHRP